ncbi:MAG: ABC transporter substrate-binding protein [Treponemataceae bacterium]|nr:ABC transporter substrate-binding protein [Treponemataceae bacterium]
MTKHNLKKAESAGSAFFVCITILLLLFITGCSKKQISSVSSSQPTDEKPLLVGFSQIGAESAWRTCNTESMQQAAQEAGIQLLYSNAEQKQENQIKAIRSFIVYQVDVIAFVPIVQDGWDSVLKEARDAGIPVLVTDRKINTSDESLYAGYIGTDGYAEGQKAARFLLNKYADSPADAHFNILEIRGTDGASVTTDRYEGFRSILSDDSRFEIVWSESGDFLRSKGQELANTLLQGSNGVFKINGKKIDIIYFHNDAMTLGFIEVLKQSGIRPGKDITIVTVDAEQAAIDALRQGDVNCVVECNPKIGPQVMDLIKDLGQGKEIPRLIHVYEQVFTEFDDLSEVEPRGY